MSYYIIFVNENKISSFANHLEIETSFGFKIGELIKNKGKKVLLLSYSFIKICFNKFVIWLFRSLSSMMKILQSNTHTALDINSDKNYILTDFKSIVYKRLVFLDEFEKVILGVIV